MIQRVEKILQSSEDSWLSVTIDKYVSHPRSTIVLCHGLTGDKIGPQKLLSDLSRYLVFHCRVDIVRFDFRGSGLSSGLFVDTTLSSMQEDALNAANISDHPILWIGISTGAIVALMASASRQKKENIIAVSNGFLESVDIGQIGSDPVSIRNGQLFLTKKYFEERLVLRPREQYFSKVGPITVVLGSEDKKHYCEYSSLQEMGIEVHGIQGADHVFTNPEKRKQLFLYLQEKINETC